VPAQSAGVQFFDVPAATKKQSANRGGLVSVQRASAGDNRQRQGHPGDEGLSPHGRKLPLVVLSHGRAGWFGGHHTTAAALAGAGFTVAAADHDNMQDRSRVDHLSVLVERPADIKRLVAFRLLTWEERARIDRDRIGLFGFSMGGYTGVGGEPDFKEGLAGCEGSDFRACEELRGGKIP